MVQQHILMAGPVVYPLLFCSVLMLALMAERFVVFVFYPRPQSAKRKRQFQAGNINGGVNSRGLLDGLNILFENKLQPKPYREELLSLWLRQERRALLASTKWLMLIGILTPLLGLLGTVLGIITMFQDVAHESGPVTPALLAAGMWEAMITTAIGVAIAIPALAAGHIFTLWAEYYVANMEQVLNECSLYIDDNSKIDAKIASEIKPSVEGTRLIKAADFAPLLAREQA